MNKINDEPTVQQSTRFTNMGSKESAEQTVSRLFNQSRTPSLKPSERHKPVTSRDLVMTRNLDVKHGLPIDLNTTMYAFR